MMGRRQQVLNTILGILILLFSGWVIVFVIQRIFAAITGMNPDIAPVLITASTTIIVAVLSLLLSKYLERQAILQEQHRERKMPLYEKLIAFLLSFLRAAKLGVPPTSEEEQRSFMYDIFQELIVWGGPEVLKAFSDLMQHIYNQPTSEQEKREASKKTLLLVEDALLSIRKDLGHNDASIKRGDILGLFITDVRQAIIETSK